jgi:CRP-like cAMP-binding protein
MFKFCEEGFIRSLVILLKPQICLPGDWLIRQGEVGREMYLIVRGTMHVIANGTVVATISDGSYVGEVAVLYEQKRIASVRAATYCHLLLLSKEDIDSVVDHYPNVLQQFETEAKLYPSIQKMLRERHKKLRERASEGNAALRQLAAHGSPQLTVRRPSNAAAAAAAAAAGVSDPSHSPVPAAAPPPERRVLRRSETNAYAPPQRSATAAAAAGTSVAAAGEGVYSIAKPASPRLKSPLHGRTDISRTLRRANTAFVASDASASEPSEPLRGPNIAEDDEDDSDETEAATAPRHARTESGPAALDRENQRAALRRREQRSAQPQ